MSPVETGASPLRGVPGIAVQGEIDLAVAPELQERLDAAIAGTLGALVLDLSGATFLDSTGIGLLLRARALLGRDERSLVLVCPPGRVRDVLELCGVDELFAIFATPDEARAALVPAR